MNSVNTIELIPYTFFRELFPEEIKLRIRFSLDSLKLDGDMLNIPLFMADQTERLIEMAIDKKK